MHANTTDFSTDDAAMYALIKEFGTPELIAFTEVKGLTGVRSLPTPGGIEYSPAGLAITFSSDSDRQRWADAAAGPADAWLVLMAQGLTKIYGDKMPMHSSTYSVCSRSRRYYYSSSKLFNALVDIVHYLLMPPDQRRPLDTLLSSGGKHVGDTATLSDDHRVEMHMLAHSMCIRYSRLIAERLTPTTALQPAPYPDGEPPIISPIPDPELRQDPVVQDRQRKAAPENRDLSYNHLPPAKQADIADLIFAFDMSLAFLQTDLPFDSGDDSKDARELNAHVLACVQGQRHKMMARPEPDPRP